MKKNFDKSGFDIMKEPRNGTQLRFETIVQGKNTQRVKKYIEGRRSINPSSTATSDKIFVVYGHDEDAKKQLELILQGWNLTPLFLDQLPSEGRTILEQLEKYLSQAKYAIVLVTPDDEGREVGCPEKNRLRPRPRQNVNCELFMAQGKLGREKVAVLLKESDPPMELPSDMDGLLYIPFTNDVEEVKLQLAQELEAAGFSISLD